MSLDLGDFLKELARMLHPNLLRKPVSQMDSALDLHFDLGARDSHSPVSKYSSALPYQPLRPPRHDQYEVFGLARIFHTDSAAACEHLMDTASGSNCS